MCVVAAWHDVGRESSFHISEHDGGRVIVDTIENDNTKRRRDGLVVVVVVVVVGVGVMVGVVTTAVTVAVEMVALQSLLHGNLNLPSKKRSIEIASTPGHSIIVWCGSMDNSSSKRFQSAATPKRKSSACEGGSIAKSNFAELPAE